MKIHNCDCGEHGCEFPDSHSAIIREFVCCGVFQAIGLTCVVTTEKFLRKCEFRDNVALIPIENLQNICVYMRFGHGVYFGIPVNEEEVE